MNVVNAKLLLATLLAFSVGAVGCATAQQSSTPSLKTTRVAFNTGQTTMNSTGAVEITNPYVVSHPVSQAVDDQTTIAPTAQLAQAPSDETIQPMLTTVAAAPLTTLGPSDDLINMVKHASGVVLLDFYADWCGPCQTQSGILHEMESTASQNNASMIKVNVDQHRGLASAFNVTSMPTLILIKDGRIIERQTGVANHQRIAALLSK